jgi:von Willebrand factor type A domain-containing protein
VTLFRLTGGWAVVLVLAVVMSAGASADTGGGLKPDLRLLIDISGSMKTSDPDNLRAPALDMIVRLLPEGARAGVWSFGEEVSVLVPHGIVDSEWRSQAQAAMARIDNSGQRTNIPAAIAAATYDLDRLDPGYRTSIVLLTDGKVDVAESPMVNAGAARKLLENEAAELGVTGIPVHTIALSGEADWVFLKSLAQASGGIAEKAEDATKLGAIFLQSLEMVAPTARVPLAGSRFTIDPSVEEFTALVFYQGETGELQLLSPGGEKYQPGDKNDVINWFQNGQFALVTVSAPVPGEWRLRAPDQATVRVSVISDLELGIDPPANSMPSDRQAEIGLWITNRGEPITDPEVLAAFKLVVEVNSPAGKVELINVSEAYPSPADGEYRVLIPLFEQPGRYELMVRLEGQTLQREMPLHIQVSPPPEEATLVTRGQEPPQDDFKAPLFILAAVLAVALGVIWLILRRRKRRKLEIWERRSRQMESGSFSREALDGVSAAEKEDPGAT